VETIPYTFYPLALPGWIAWALFLSATVGGITVGIARGQGRGWRAGLRAGMFGLIGLLATTMFASMIIAFLVHDL
jgi:hypothetical protein